MAHYGAKGRNSESASGFKPAMEHATSDILTLVSYDFQKKTSINTFSQPTNIIITHLSLSTASITKVKEKHKKKVKEKNTKK